MFVFCSFFLPIFLLLLGPIHQVWNDNVSYILNYAVIYYYKNLSNKINHIQCTIYVEGTVISDLYCSCRKLLMKFIDGFFKLFKWNNFHFLTFIVLFFCVSQIKHFSNSYSLCSLHFNTLGDNIVITQL